MSKVLLKLHGMIYSLHQLGIPVLPAILNKIFIRLLFGCQLGVKTKFGKKVELGYGGLGIVIHERAVIGNYVNIGP